MREQDSCSDASIAERHHRRCEMAGDERKTTPAPWIRVRAKRNGPFEAHLLPLLV